DSQRIRGGGPRSRSARRAHHRDRYRAQKLRDADARISPGPRDESRSVTGVDGIPGESTRVGPCALQRQAQLRQTANVGGPPPAACRGLAMNLPEIAVRRRVFAWMLMAGLIIFGLIG